MGTSDVTDRIGLIPSYPPSPTDFMLNPEFDLLLTALLDDELETEPRRRVESAVRVDPAAADRLAVLTRVRDLVATLPPVPAPDVSGEVVSILASRRRSAFRTIRFAGAVASTLAAAAFLMMISGPTQPSGRLAVAPASDRIKPRPSPVAPTPPAIVAHPTRPTPARPTFDAAIREDVLTAEIRRRDDRAGLDNLVRQTDAQVIDVLVDEVGPASVGALDDIVRTTSRFRPNHARVQVVQGIEIDPSRPGRACVYVLVMDEHEYAKFRRKLDDRFPESASKPASIARDSVASLSKVGQVEFFRDALPAGTLTDPPADLSPEVAIRSPSRDAGEERFIPPGGRPLRPGQPKSLPDHSGKLPGVAKPTEKAKESSRLVYVVWLSPRDRPRG